jgi:uncharacterized protein
MQTTIFHLAFPIGNIPDAKAFYIDGLGAVAGRASPNALILNLAGTQLVGHITSEELKPQRAIYPRHFGLVFTQLADYRALYDRALSHDLNFYQPERQRFPGTPLEHWTFFLEDPFYNLLEFKHYSNPEAIFGELGQTQIGDRA